MNRHYEKMGQVVDLAHCDFWWAILGSNQWLPPCEGGTLPLS